MIELRNLTTGYAGRALACNLNQTLCSGELVSLLGANGAGKSTLLRTLCGLQRPLAGEVMVKGQPLSQLSPGQQSRLVSVVLTERTDVRSMTVGELVALGRSPHTGFFGRLSADDHRIVVQAMDEVGIRPLQGRHITTLSDGERQKAMIARALAQQTPVILLDEPTAFLDFPSKVETLRLLSRLAHEMQKAILLSTHDVELALRLSDRLWLMDGDRLLAGTPERLKDDGTIERMFRWKF